MVQPASNHVGMWCISIGALKGAREMGLTKLDQGTQVRHKYGSSDIPFNMVGDATGLPLEKSSTARVASCARPVKLKLLLE